MSKTGIVIQARMGSTRLPGKVLFSLPEGSHLKTLDWVIGACRETGYHVIVATSTNPEDVVIAEFVRDRWMEEAVDIYRGDPIDVLDRLYQCSKFFSLDEIVRITGDCPFIDPEVILQVIMLRRLHGADYASNVDPATWPDGLDVQVVTMAALTEAWQHATAPTDRDTVLQYIVRNRKEFSVVNLPCPIPGMEGRRWVLDTREDYAICSAIATRLLEQHKYHPRLVDMLALGADETGMRSSGARNERFLAARAAELAPDNFSGSIETAAVARQTQPYGASTYSKSHVAFGDIAPLYVTHASGSRVFDVDGNEFIDFTGALGTTILGHGDPGIRDAIQAQLDLGIAFPLAHDMERIVARALIQRIHPGKLTDDYQVVFGKNGSDVTSAAVRLARVVTGRVAVLAHAEGYHGWHDWALTGTARGGGTFPSQVYRLAYDAHLDDLALSNCACLIIEPDRVPLEVLRATMERCRIHGILIIFDEMVTAFRYAGLTYANTYDLEPDLICLGKALGNGMPIATLVGRKEHMRRFVSEHPLEPYAFYSGTHFGEMLSLAAAGEVLRRMQFDELLTVAATSQAIHDLVMGERALAGLSDVILVGPPPLSRLTFINGPGDAATFRQMMIRNGCLVYSAFFASLAHSDADLSRLGHALKEATQKLAHPTDEPSDMPAAAGIMRS